MVAVALGVVGAGAAVVAGVRPSGMAALCLCAWGLAEAGAALWERLRQEAAPGAALWGMPRPPITLVAQQLSGLRLAPTSAASGMAALCRGAWSLMEAGMTLWRLQRNASFDTCFYGVRIVCLCSR